jgi:hypothetical protein
MREADTCLPSGDAVAELLPWASTVVVWMYGNVQCHGDWTEIRCLAVDKVRINSTVSCTLGYRIENRQLRSSTVADVLCTIL